MFLSNSIATLRLKRYGADLTWPESGGYYFFAILNPAYPTNSSWTVRRIISRHEGSTTPDSS